MEIRRSLQLGFVLARGRLHDIQALGRSRYAEFRFKIRDAIMLGDNVALRSCWCRCSIWLERAGRLRGQAHGKVKHTRRYAVSSVEAIGCGRVEE